MSAGDGRQNFVATVGRGMQPADVRQANQRAVLTVIAAEPGLSNAELSRRTGLAPQSVSAVLADLEAASLVNRGEVLRGRRGQPATPLYLNPRGAFAVGAEIGWTHVEVVLAGLEGQEIARFRRDHASADPARAFDDLRAGVEQVMASLSNSERGRLAVLSLATPPSLGLSVGTRSGALESAGLWAGVDIAARAAAATGLEVQLTATGGAACWAEIVSLPAPYPHGFLFILIDALIESGLVAEMRFWDSSAVANLGAMLVMDRKGTQKSLNEIASLSALDQRLRAANFAIEQLTADPRPEPMTRLVGEWIADCAFALAQAVFNSATLVQFEVAIVEGELPAADRQRLLSAVGAELSKLSGLAQQNPRLRLGHLGRSGAAQGAAQRVLYQRFFSRRLEHMSE